MHQVDIMESIRRCREIDETAQNIYAKLSQSAETDELAKFWTEMSREESEHVGFWRRAELIEGLSELPEMFDDPDQLLSELDRALSRATDLLDQCGGKCSAASAFTIAYRMEFYLLHPAFETLFHLLGPTAGGPNPEDEYEAHIAKFITMLEKHGNVTPELELLGETIAALWKENRQLAVQSSRDELTGVLNRRGFFTISTQFAHLAQRTGSRVAVMMIDLDHFKSINDRLGHAAGDRVLTGTAALLTQRLRASDLVGRYGGEEFVILLTNIGKSTTAKLAEELRKAIEKDPPEEIPVTVSIGFAEAKLGSDVVEDYNLLIEKADAALYQAKEAGRNRVVEYVSETD